MTAAPDLLSIVYTSATTDPMDATELGDILTASRAANSRREVTGLLLHREGRFIQFLEGPEPTVRELVRTIAADDRHTRVRVLLEEKITDRQFAEWTMGFETVSDEPHLEGFRDSFDDLENSGDRDLMAQAARDLTGWFRAASRA